MEKYPSQSELERIIQNTTPSTDINSYLGELPKEDSADNVISYIVASMLGQNENMHFIGLMEDCAAWIDMENKFKADDVNGAIERLKELGWKIDRPSGHAGKQEKERYVVVNSLPMGVGYKIIDLANEKIFWPRLEKIKEIYDNSDEREKEWVYFEGIKALLPRIKLSEKELGRIPRPEIRVYGGDRDFEDIKRTFVPYGLHVRYASSGGGEVKVGTHPPFYDWMKKPTICEIVKLAYFGAIQKLSKEESGRAPKDLAPL